MRKPETTVSNLVTSNFNSIRKAPVKPVSEQDVVNYVLHQTAAIMLAASPLKDSIQKAADKHRAELFTRMTPAERSPIITMRDVVVEFCRKLGSCTDQETLNQTYAYLKALNDGEVMVAVANDEGTVVQYEKNV